jgi:hypothetical protein
VTFASAAAYNDRMQRVLGLLVFVGCAWVFAGCGGASLRQIAQRDSKELLGEPHPQILHTETARIVDGAREAVVQMHGHFTIVPDCPHAVAPAKNRCHTLHPRYVVLTFSLPKSGSAQGYATITSSQMESIARARRAQRWLALFPDFNGEIVRCAIPRGSPPGGTIPGTCVTYAFPYHHVRRVELIEHWPQSEPSGSRNKAGWIVLFGRDGHVRSVRVTGQPPQLWK